MTKQELNDFVLSQGGSFQQSYQWGELQERMGREVRRFLGDGFAATFVRHDLKMGKYYWLCPRGPVGQIDNLLSIISNLGGVFVRVEPELTPALSLEKRGWKKAPKDHNPRATVLVNLSRGEAELLAMMHPKARYNLRLAQKKGIKFIDSGSMSGMTDGFWDLLQKTAKRDKFYLHPQKYYELLAQMPEIKIFGIYYEDELITTAMVSFWGDTAVYLHGASDYEYRALMAPYLLHWEIIRQAKASGLHYYDFGGVAPKDELNHFLAGVSRFKSGWGGEYREYAGSWDYVLDKKWYWIYKMARKFL